MLFVPEDGSNIREYKVSSRIFGLLKGFSIVLLVVVLSAGVAYWKATRWALAARQMEEENRMLRAENAKVVKLARMLEEVQQSRRRLEVMLRGEARTEREETTRVSAVLRSSEFRTSSRSRPNIRRAELTKNRRTSLGGFRRRPSLWPVKGRVTARFEEHPGWLKREYSGISIAAAKGALVCAAADGEVTFAGWENALGNLMILDHGGRYTTWYGRNERLLVQEGEFVRKGQPIALAGNTGYGTGVYLHYEVRENGTSVDPETFMLW